MKPVSITDVSIKELSLIVPQHKGKEWEARNQDAQVLMVKGAEVEPKADDKRSAIAKAFDVLKGYFMADYQPAEPVQFPVTEAVDNIDNDGDGPEDYNAIVSAICSLYGDISQAYCISDDSARSAAIVGAIDSFLEGLDALRKGDDEKAGARHSKADAAHIQAIADAHQAMAEHIAALQPKSAEDDKAAVVDEKAEEVTPEQPAAAEEIGKAAPVEDEMKPEDVQAMIAEALKAQQAETDAKIEAAKAEAKAEAQIEIDAAKAAAETAKAQAAEAKTAADVQAELAERYKAEAAERGAVLKAAAGLATKATATSAVATGGESRLSQVLKAQLAQSPMSHQF